MALLDDILNWTEKDLVPWQRDAARRLFRQEAGLTEEDYAQLYALLKAAHNLPNPLNLIPVPLAAAHLPKAPSPGKGITLKTMRDLKHVNRIASGQKLNFSPSGITVVYGPNGSGKSGYARVMKRACRARDQAEKVHPDANDPNAHTCVPETFFEIEVDGSAQTVKWTATTTAPDELATIAVFDSHCARAYITAEHDVAFLPYGLDVVENLGNKVLPELTRRLETETNAISVDKQPFDHLLGDTKVGLLISGLSDKTDPDRINLLGKLSEKETVRLAELEAALSVADPIVKAKELRLVGARMKAQAIRIRQASAWVTDEAVAKLKTLDDGVTAANLSETEAAKTLRAGESLLPGTGDAVWKALFEAARRFSLEAAYPGHDFPHTQSDANCPLCQQKLTDGADRLQRFETYIKEDVAKATTEQLRIVTGAKTKIVGANLSIGMDKATIQEIDSLDKTIVPLASSYETSIEARRKWMLAALDSHTWTGIHPFTSDPSRQIRDLAATQIRTARTFEKAANPEQQSILKTERNELLARKKLSDSLASVLALVGRMKQKAALKSCESDLKTRPFSDKAKEFASSAITAALKTALDTEFKALGIGHIETKLKERSEKGKNKYRLLLNLPTANKLEEILSEGEQRALALGSFLAELTLANHSGGIVFDDPVSSLDHWRRQDVAKRLVKEAARRQVVVFTHNTSFLGQLRDEIEKASITHSIQFLEWLGPNSGCVADGLPWGHQSYKERISHLEKAQIRLTKKPWPAYPNNAECGEMCQQYDLLRATIERVIQDVVFNGVVERYRDWVKVGNLAAVVGFEDAECKEIARLYQRCNEIVDAHDPSSGKNSTVPTAAELGKDLADLKTLIEKILNRRKKSKAALVTP